MAKTSFSDKTSTENEKTPVSETPVSKNNKKNKKNKTKSPSEEEEENEEDKENAPPSKRMNLRYFTFSNSPIY